MSKIELIKPKESWVRIIQRSDWLVFTSSAAVRAFPSAIGDLRKVARAKFAVVGKATAEVLRSIGFQPDWVGPGPGGEALARSWPRKACGSILHLTGSIGDGKFVSLLKANGRNVRKIVLYKNSEASSVPVPVGRALKEEGADWVVFASGSAAVRFRQLFPVWRKGEPRVVVIGPATAKAARSSGWKRIVQSNEASIEGCLRTML